MRQITSMVSVAVGVGLLVQAVFAQSSSQVILTWQAHNYYPANFEGKAPATPSAPVAIAAEVVRENNKLADLTRAEFTWYIDEEFFKSGTGLKEILASAKGAGGDQQFVRAVIKINGEKLEAATRIPIRRPEVVIENSYPKNLIKAGGRAVLRAVPYFFNVASLQDLIFFWQVNEGAAERGEGDNQLTLNIGDQEQIGEAVNVTASVQSGNNPLEFGKERMRLKISGY